MFLLSRVTDIVHSLLTTHKETILPFFDHLLPMFSQLLAKDRPWADRQWSLCIFDDLIENVGPVSVDDVGVCVCVVFSYYLHLFMLTIYEYIIELKIININISNSIIWIIKKK